MRLPKLPSLSALRSMSPGDYRFMVDDALFLANNLKNRLKEQRLPAETRALLKRNTALRATQGGRCWVIGNGPSLKEHDLTQLRDEHVFVVNRFIHHPDAHLIKPRYYVIIDPKFGNGTWGTDFIEEVERRLPDTTMFITPDGERFLNERKLLQSHTRHVILPNQLFHFGYPFDIDLTRGIPGSDNVTKASIAIAAWMGYAEINLLGIDGNGLLLSNNSHFYGHVAPPETQLELEKSMASSALSMRSWRALPGYLENRGIRLISRNPRSVLNALPLEPWPTDLPPGLPRE